jgi:ribosome-associated protein
LANKLTKDNVLVINNEQSRSQHKNKEAIIQQFFHTIKNGLQRQKRRKKTKPSRISKLKRLNSKKRHAEKKTNRKPPKL